MKTALITGITGQDGSYLSELLISKGYRVIGIVRRSSSVDSRGRLDHLDPDVRKKIILQYGDMTDASSLVAIIKRFEPSEVYNLAAQSHVKISFDQPIYTSEVTGVGTLNVLEAIRISGLNVRFYQASSSEQFGKVAHTPQNESTPFYPRSPYGVSKVFAHWITVNYREAYGMHNSCGILFNHESPRRGENFVTRKISLGVAKIKEEMDAELRLGNIDSQRDWGFAGDYVEAMWLMLQQEKPDDYVVATGVSHTVRDFCEAAFSHAGMDYKDYVKTDSEYFRPSEVDALRGDAAKAREKLGWKPKTDFKSLVGMMVDSDLAFVRNNFSYKHSGFRLSRR
ncbi:TPA: GDP-mannose 4,6-dehydratase [Candidatus Micrarchaeota archaeon]|nr:GDP-mannose 4,6-dehydratase [Candidatus Micrarchaeota archaeon]